jgi:hypothetical protein
MVADSVGTEPDIECCRELPAVPKRLSLKLHSSKPLLCSYGLMLTPNSLDHIAISTQPIFLLSTSATPPFAIRTIRIPPITRFHSTGFAVVLFQHHRFLPQRQSLPFEPHASQLPNMAVRRRQQNDTERTIGET